MNTSIYSSNVNNANNVSNGVIGDLSVIGNDVYVNTADGNVMIAPSESNTINITDDAILQVGDASITGKQLGMLIKILKKKFPEILLS